MTQHCAHGYSATTPSPRALMRPRRLTNSRRRPWPLHARFSPSAYPRKYRLKKTRTSQFSSRRCSGLSIHSQSPAPRLHLRRNHRHPPVPCPHTASRRSRRGDQSRRPGNCLRLRPVESLVRCRVSATRTTIPGFSQRRPGKALRRRNWKANWSIPGHFRISMIPITPPGFKRRRPGNRALH